MDLPVSTGRNYRAPENQEVVRIDFQDTDIPSYEHSLDTLPTPAEKNSIFVAGKMKLYVGISILNIPNGTD